MRFSCLFLSRRRLPSGCFPVLPAQALLRPHEAALSGLSACLSVPDRVWRTCYLPFFSNAAAWLQQLPAEESALFPVRLARAAADVASTGGRPPPFAGETGVDRIKLTPVWQYAVVINSLCGGLGSDLLSLRVRLFEPDGTYRGEWNCLTGTMTPGSCYRFDLLPAPTDAAPGIDLWLARTWLPAPGLTWLASCPGAIRWLLDHLCGLEGTTDVVQISRPAESVAAPAPAHREPPESGQVFMDWLQSGLDEGRVAVNSAGSPVCFVDQGILLLSPKLFILYSPTGWRKAQRAFQRMRLHVRRPDGGDIWSYRFTDSGLKVHGFLLPSAQVSCASRFKPCTNLTRCESIV